MSQRDTRSLVAHLFRRAGFGLEPDELDRFASLGVDGCVDYLVNYESTVDPAETQLPGPDLSQFAYALPQPAQRTAASLRRQGQLQYQARLAIQEWWINRMLTTSRPLQEKMTLFWHGHFATGIAKANPSFMLQQNQLFRASALGNFSSLLLQVNQDPAMLLWLDGATNRAGKPNENFSRELMELFTIGIGHFAESDVREGARALTGWTLPLQARAAGLKGEPAQAVFVPRLFDAGWKTYLGNTGNLGAGDVMRILSAHPDAGPFLTGKIFSFFAYDNPSDDDLAPLVDTYYRSHYDVKAVVRQLLLSDAFYSDQAFEQHVKSPVEFVVGTVRELGLMLPADTLNAALILMGQELFNPPNVGGWPSGLSWVNEGTLVERFNFAGRLSTHPPTAMSALDLNGLVQQSGVATGAQLVDYLLNRFIGVGPIPASRGALLDYLGGSLSAQTVDQRLRGLLQLVFASPEYQLN